MRTGAANVVVVDNHSPFHSVVRKLEKLHGVTVRRFSRNLGFARGVNRGVSDPVRAKSARRSAARLDGARRATGCLLLNPDVTVEDGFLDDVATFVEKLAAADPNDRSGRFPAAKPRWVAAGVERTIPDALTRTLAGLFLPALAAEVYAPTRVDAPAGGLGDRRVLARPPRLLPATRRARRVVLPLLRGRGLLPSGCRGRVGCLVRPIARSHAPLAAARSGGCRPRLRLMTRHALLTYARKHWSGWRARMMSAVVWAEAAAASGLGRGPCRLGRDRAVTAISDGSWATWPPRATRMHAAGSASPPHFSTRSRPNRMAEPTSGHLRLSVVIPSHVRADLLRLCLASVERFAPSGTETIVVDDGSPGGVVSRTAREYGAIRIIRHARARGFCASANAGIALATAPVVQLLNDDTEVTEGWAEAALQWFADERVAAVAPLVLQNDPHRRAAGLPALIDTAGDEYDLGGFARKRGRGQECDRYPFPRGGVFGASACAAFYRRDAILRAGGFPEHFRAYFEDVDLSFRLRRMGFDILYDPNSVVWHRVSASYGRRPSRRVLEQQSCNEERVFWRNVRGYERLRWLPRHAVVLAGKAIRRFQERTFLPWFLGRVRAVLESSNPVGAERASSHFGGISEAGVERTCPESVSAPRIAESISAQPSECV